MNTESQINKSACRQVDSSYGNSSISGPDGSQQLKHKFSIHFDHLDSDTGLAAHLQKKTFPTGFPMACLGENWRLHLLLLKIRKFRKYTSTFWFVEVKIKIRTAYLRFDDVFPFDSTLDIQGEVELLGYAFYGRSRARQPRAIDVQTFFLGLKMTNGVNVHVRIPQRIKERRLNLDNRNGGRSFLLPSRWWNGRLLSYGRKSRRNDGGTFLGRSRVGRAETFR